ncbi:unnamed protein product, partial [Ectocarpus fasciculatus]
MFHFLREVESAFLVSSISCVMSLIVLSDRNVMLDMLSYLTIGRLSHEMFHFESFPYDVDSRLQRCSGEHGEKSVSFVVSCVAARVSFCLPVWLSWRASTSRTACKFVEPKRGWSISVSTVPGGR